jgi:hypothetical protein
VPAGTRSLAWKKQKPHERSHREDNRITRHSRTRMVLTVSFALAPETGLYCLRHRRDGKHRRQFDISIGISGPHDFAVRFKLRSSCAAKASIASRTQRP